jgi:lipopolysaccharide biosynthesis glycosyltransferase
MIPIVSATDDGYVHHFAAMLHSAKLYHPDGRFYLLDAGVSAANLDRLKCFRDRWEIDLAVVPCRSLLDDRLPGYPVISSYSRLLIPEVLGDDMERCLYIDADTTVVNSLESLAAVDLEGFPIAAMPDSGDWGFVRRESEAHGIEFGENYFNTGVMVMDLARWRAEGIAGRAFDYARAYPERMLLWDQSSLNVILHLRNKPIDQIWNFFKLRDAGKLSAPPHIVHYTTLPKPTEWPESPFADLYKFHRDQTPWPFTKLPPTRRSRFKEARTFLGAAAGIKKYRERLEYERLLDFIRTDICAPALARARVLSQARSLQ